MTGFPGVSTRLDRVVLLSLPGPSNDGGWSGKVADALSRTGLVISRTYSTGEACRRVEQGGLVAAVVTGGDKQRPVVSLLHAIRSVDSRLPCWLMMRVVERQVLETAFQLRVVSVLTPPIEDSELTLYLRRTLVGSEAESLSSRSNWST